MVVVVFLVVALAKVGMVHAKRMYAVIIYKFRPGYQIDCCTQCWLHSIVFRSTPSCTSSQSGLSSRKNVTRSWTALST